MSLIYDKGKVYCYLRHDTTYDSWPKPTETCRNFPSRYSLMEFRLFHIPRGKSRKNFYVLAVDQFCTLSKAEIKNETQILMATYVNIFHHLWCGCQQQHPKLLKQCLVQAWGPEYWSTSKGCSLGGKSAGKYSSSKFQCSHMLSLHVLDYCQSFSALLSCELHCKYFMNQYLSIHVAFMRRMVKFAFNTQTQSANLQRKHLKYQQ